MYVCMYVCMYACMYVCICVGCWPLSERIHKWKDIIDNGDSAQVKCRSDRNVQHIWHMYLCFAPYTIDLALASYQMSKSPKRNLLRCTTHTTSHSMAALFIATRRSTAPRRHHQRKDWLGGLVQYNTLSILSHQRAQATLNHTQHIGWIRTKKTPL